MRWIDRILLVGVAAAFLGSAALYAGAQHAGALDRADGRTLTESGDLEHRIAKIVERCVIQGAGTHLAFIRCELRN